MSVIAALYPLTITRGADFIEELQFIQEDGTPWDLTGCKARMQIREQRAREAALILEPAVEITDFVTGKVRITTADPDTLAITHHSGWYDVIIQDVAGIDAYYVYGPVMFANSATENPL